MTTEIVIGLIGVAGMILTWVGGYHSAKTRFSVDIKELQTKVARLEGVELIVHENKLRIHKLEGAHQTFYTVLMGVQKDTHAILIEIEKLKK